MMTTVSPLQPASMSNIPATPAADSIHVALFQTVALMYSRAYRDHIRKLLLIGLEDIGDE